ncbi:permease [Clostridium estertheticum]|uniref:permease n=1 Tax=Clostridium estertheticum TaxID=238834 RepID=UPI001CF38003|nr:permease [Clostridium estertheticum]MCB2305133.1 permease [Clostridium estertheticum]MCB2343597.1 permease [Clostridium estertheticum]MCB2348517.1 permease [Clostridium estertheticum]WAG47461.1 permease [Clostridium estertheticum]
MKIKVDIVTGFLGSGKTKLINNKLENEVSKRDITVIIQCEKGQTNIEPVIKNKNLFIEDGCKENDLDKEYINYVIKKYRPTKIIIEANGMKKIDNLIEIFDYLSISRKCFINEIVHTIDVSTFDIFMNNMGSILINQILNSDFIILNNTGNFHGEKLNKIERTLKRINKSAKISKGIFILAKPKAFNNEILLLIAILGFVIAYLVYSVFKPTGFDITKIFLPWLERFNIVFLSILIQAFPFVLFGVFVSAIIQVNVSSEKITNIFPENRALQFIVAIFAGLFFPVCDCAIVPVGARLIKKGVPLPAAVTFMLAAPIVNPIVIASTLFAFPSQPSIAIYRVGLGITVAFLVGVVFMLVPEKDILPLGNIDVINCNCGFCNNDYNNKKGILGNVDAIFNHAGAEFFQIGKFIIIGAFLSSIMQTLIPKEIFGNIGGGTIISLLIMMLFAFILSVCSTSDAFIARTFVNQFSIGSIMGFLVLGPMLDIKNLLMLLGNFKKRFVIKLVFLILLISFEILIVFATLF